MSKELTEQELFDQYTRAKASGDEATLGSLLSEEVKVVSEKVDSLPEPKVPEQEVEEQAEGKEAPEATEGKTEQKIQDDPFAKESQPAPTESNKEPVSPTNKKDAPPASSAESVETLRAELAKITQERDEFKHKFNSNAGRITAFQKTIADLQSRLALLEQTQPRKAADKPSKKADLRTDPRFVKLAEADPVLADIVGGLLETAVEGVREEYETGLQQTTRTMADVEKQRYIQEQNQIVKEVVPNIDEVVQSKEFQFFYENVATPRLKALLDSEHAVDGIEGLRIYAGWLEAQTPKKPEEAKPESKVAPTQNDDEARKLAEARDRRLKVKDVSGSQVTPQGKGGAGEEDLEALFNQATKATLQRVMPLKR